MLRNKYSTTVRILYKLTGDISDTHVYVENYILMIDLIEQSYHIQLIITTHIVANSLKQRDRRLFTQGRRNEKRARGANFVEGHRQNFNYVKIHTRKFRGSIAFFLHQILTHHILSIASAITLDINTSQISSIYSATAGLIIAN